MQTLFPIIRRKRRPLIVADTTPVMAGKSVGTKPVEPAKAEKQPEKPDAQTTINRDAE